MRKFLRWLIQTLTIWALSLGLLHGCASLPRARAADAATLAITATNTALEVAINLAPEPYDAATWEYRVVLLERAADAVRRGQDVCQSVPDLMSLARVIRCTRCAVLVEAMPCQ